MRVPRPAPMAHLLPSLLVLAAAAPALGQTQAAEPAPWRAGASGSGLQVVVVSASRYEQFASDLALSMDVIGSRQLEQGQMMDIRDAAKALPNVSVKRAPARFSVTGRGNAVGADGNAGFSIRGQGGNRVTMLVDGIRLPRSYINGSNAFGRDSVDLGLVKRIEIVRGPTSALYGSDGLAGLVNFISHEPADFLKDAGHGAPALGGKAWL
ncbi:MAG: TonB-dependent receptor plug domain-containing protein, partial [Rubrivivax sp.]|nr:TonB-dependent receptor plug domain-containing protein [Rubrivivax sp.]